MIANQRLLTAFRKACKRAVMVGFHFHDLRHFAGSHLINNGMPIFKVSKFLGHRNVKTTEIYTHINDESLEEVGEAFGSESAVPLEPAVWVDLSLLRLSILLLNFRYEML